MPTFTLSLVLGLQENSDEDPSSQCINSTLEPIIELPQAYQGSKLLHTSCRGGRNKMIPSNAMRHGLGDFYNELLHLEDTLEFP